MSNSTSLVSSLAKYFGPDFKSTNSILRDIYARRSGNLTEQVERDKVVDKELQGNSDRPLTLAEVDDLALANPVLRMKLDRSSANHQETASIDHQTFVDEGRRISQLLEKYSDTEIDQLRSLFLVTLAGEGPAILRKLDADDAEGIREIIAMVNHLNGVLPFFF